MGFLGLAVPHKDFGSKTWCLLSKEALDSPGTALVPENQMFIYVHSFMCLDILREKMGFWCKVPAAEGYSQCCDSLCWSLYVASWTEV